MAIQVASGGARQQVHQKRSLQIPEAVATFAAIHVVLGAFLSENCSLTSGGARHQVQVI